MKRRVYNTMLSVTTVVNLQLAEMDKGSFSLSQVGLILLSRLNFPVVRRSTSSHDQQGVAHVLFISYYYYYFCYYYLYFFINRV